MDSDGSERPVPTLALNVNRGALPGRAYLWYPCDLAAAGPSDERTQELPNSLNACTSETELAGSGLGRLVSSSPCLASLKQLQ